VNYLTSWITINCLLVMKLITHNKFVVVWKGASLVSGSNRRGSSGASQASHHHTQNSLYKWLPSTGKDIGLWD
jgi:hypothetical protein